MAIAAPVMVVVDAGQDATVTVTIPTDTTNWTLTAWVKAASGSATLITKTVGSGIVNTPGPTSSTVVITFLAADTTGLQPGGYVWGLERTNAAADYWSIDESSFRIRGTVTGSFPSYTNLSEFLAHTGQSETVSDADVKFYLQLISAAEQLLSALCGRQFFYGIYTEWDDAPLRGNIFVRETPIWSITSVNYDGAGGFGELTGTFGSDTLLTAGQDYYFRKDHTDGKGYAGEVFVGRRNASWWGWSSNWGFGRGYTPGLLATRPEPIPGAFKFVYVGGYAIIPDDIKLAVWEIVADREQARARGVGLQSESGMNYSYSLAPYTDEISKLGSVASVIAKYKHGETYFA